MKVHRLVLLAFIGEASSMCCHEDGNPLNNHLSNLRYGTAQDNADDRSRHGRKVGAVGESNGVAKLTIQKVQVIKSMLAEGLSQRHIAKNFGVCAESIRKIAINQTWKHV